MKNARRWIGAVALAGLVSIPAASQGLWGCDDGPGPRGHGFGRGMTDGWAGPGAMGGWGGGPGAMGGWGGGPGASGGFGPGYGMGMGPGVMRGFDGLELTTEQRSKLREIQKGLRTKTWALMGRMMEARDRLDDLYDANVLDKAAIDAQYKEIDDVRRQMVDASVDARNQMRGLLTKEQQEKFDRARAGRPMR